MYTLNSTEVHAIAYLIYDARGNGEGGVSFTINSRDFKGVMIIVVSESDRSIDGKQSSRELLRSGCVQQYVSNGE